MAQELEAYLAAMQATSRQQQADVEALQASVDEVARVRRLVAQLPEKVRHNAMVPYGKHAFFEGELIHTNEFNVGLGCDLRLEASATQAAAILGRRQVRGEEALRRARAGLEELLAKAAELQLSLSNEEGEAFMEIRQDLEESEELLASAALARPPQGLAAARGSSNASFSGAGQRLPFRRTGEPLAGAGDATAGSAAAAAGGRGAAKGEDEGEDERIFARLAELERLEAEAGSDGEGSAGGSDREAEEGAAVEGKGGSTAGLGAAGAARGPQAVAGAVASTSGVATSAAGAAPAGTGSKPKAASAFKKGFLLGGPSSGVQKKAKATGVSPPPGASPDLASTSASSDDSRVAAQGPGAGPSGVLKSTGSGSSDNGSSTRVSSEGAGGANGDADVTGPRRRRVSFADGSAPGDGDDGPSLHERPSPLASVVPPRRTSGAGSSLRSALKEGSGRSVAYQQGQEGLQPPGAGAGPMSARVLERVAGLEEEAGDAAMAMARAREAAFTGFVRERGAEDEGRVRMGEVTATLVPQEAAEAAQAPKRISKFKQQRMGAA